jgi:hypothetical protein
MSEIDRLYTSAENGLKRTNDMFEKMQTGEQFSRLVKGIDPLIERADLIKTHALDYTVYGAQLSPVIDEEGVKFRISGDTPMDGKEYKVTEWSLSQICGQLKIPTSYAIEMIKAGKHALLIENFNSWLKSHAAGKKFLMRTIDDKLRGILSSRYQPIDADYMLPKLREKLKTTDHGFYVDKAILNPEYTNIRIISDRKFSVDGDPHFIGMRYSSSDVGRAGFKYELFMFRSRCTNGMFFGKKDFNSISHTHTIKEFFNDGYFEKEMDLVVQSIEPMTNRVGKALEIAQTKVLDEKSVARIMEQFQTRTKVTKKDIEAVRSEIMIASANYSDVTTAWSLTNAFTEVAQHQNDPTQAEQMERFSGELLFELTK